MSETAYFWIKSCGLDSDRTSLFYELINASHLMKKTLLPYSEPLNYYLHYVENCHVECDNTADHHVIDDTIYAISRSLARSSRLAFVPDINLHCRTQRRQP
jgi:hypothetical protein